jgi:glycosyltransferase involved in cell wall biosynthesis
MTLPTITTHTIVRNEEYWIWYALMAVKDYVNEMLVYDDNSADKTVNIIRGIGDPRIKLQTGKLLTPADYTQERNRMIQQTKTEWFLILDGDEVWNRSMFFRLLEFAGYLNIHIDSVSMRTRNCIGDIYHYLPEDAVRYQLLGRRGHLSTRLFRNRLGLHWKGDYPLESLRNARGGYATVDPRRSAFFEGFYWHMTHLPRTSRTAKVKGRRKRKYELGIPVTNKDEFPEVFTWPRPEGVRSPWRRMSTPVFIASGILTPLKRLRRGFRH